MRIVLGACILLLLALPSGADARISGIYSNLEFNEEGGDLLGFEILLLPTHGGWSAVVQVAEGELAVPFVAPVTVKGSTISFEIPDQFGAGVFVGEVSTKELTGTFGRQKVRLRRGKSYWEQQSAPKAAPN